MRAINLAETRTVGQFTGHALTVVKAKGPFVWHKHEDTDDFFLVFKGPLTLQMREGSIHHVPLPTMRHTSH